MYWLLFALLIINLTFIGCQRPKPKPKTEKKISLETVQKPVVWDSLVSEIPFITFPLKINASTYFKGAVDYEYAKKFFDGKHILVKDGSNEVLQIKDERNTSFYYIGKFNVSSNVIAIILYNASLQEFYVVTFEKLSGKWIDALEIAKIHKKENGSEILECIFQDPNDIHLTYQFLSKSLNVEDIPPKKLIFKIHNSGKIMSI